MKTIVMIGPVYPFKSGIAYYTGMMANSLKKLFKVHIISFKMQYPKILYKQEQYDFENETMRVEGVDFLINTANPFNWPSVSRRIKEINPDYLIVPWWHPYFAPCYIGLLSLLKKYPVIFVCHNVFPHERFPLDITLTKRVLKRGNGFITHSTKDTRDLKSILPEANCITTVLPSYENCSITNITCEEAREKLNISLDKKLLLFFGFVKKYKGLKHLLNAMPEIVQYDGNIELMIVGEFDSDSDAEYYRALMKDLGIERYVRLVNRYVPDKEVEKYFAACDIVVLPYESATQSGIIQMSYGFGKPVIATRVGGLPDVVIDGKTGYLTEPCDPHNLAQAVIRYYESGNQMQFKENIRGEAYKYSWDRMNEIVCKLIEKIDNIYIYIYIYNWF